MIYDFPTCRAPSTISILFLSDLKYSFSVCCIFLFSIMKYYLPMQKYNFFRFFRGCFYNFFRFLEAVSTTFSVFLEAVFTTFSIFWRLFLQLFPFFGGCFYNFFHFLEAVFTTFSNFFWRLLHQLERWTALQKAVIPNRTVEASSPTSIVTGEPMTRGLFTLPWPAGKPQRSGMP